MKAARALAQIIHGADAVYLREASHLCDNRICMRASHIFPEPAAANKSRTGCKAPCQHILRCLHNKGERGLRDSQSLNA